jgi:putative ABC transport system ATP-binding protein
MADKVILMKNGKVEKSYLNATPLPVDEIEW